MPLRPFPVAVLGVIALQPLWAANTKPDQLQQLLSRSPFGNAPVAVAVSPAADQPLEFRGVLEETGGRLFSIYNTATRLSAWMEQNRPMDGISIATYDEARECVTVLYCGEPLELRLKGAAKHFRPAPSDLPKKAGGTGNREYHDKPFRLGHVFEETLIRRAVRQSVAPPAKSATPTPTPDSSSAAAAH